MAAGDIRREKIVEIVKKHSGVSCADLSKIFKVTPETIRRDLEYLQDQKLLIRTHGGAIASVEAEMLPAALRKQENFEQKLAIARKASSYISEGDVIFMDAGTTVNLICEFMPQDKEFFVVTNSKESIVKLADVPNITLISTGGILRKKTMAFAGENAMQSLRSITFNKAFISALAVSEKYGIMDSHSDEANINRLALEKAIETFLLVDATKFNKMAYINVCPIDHISTIITDDRLSSDIHTELEQKGLNVIICNSSGNKPEQ